jgi:low temperature requirement protein LtrA
VPVLSVLRNRDAEPGVTNMELFFDLVYVFAVTQLTHRLSEQLTARGALETLILFGAVWWAWNYTAWATNWIDPDMLPVRVLLIALMVLGLVMSADIPGAFGAHGLGFAVAYVALQMGRSAFVAIAFGSRVMGRNYRQLLAWSAIAGVAWIAGACVHGNARLIVWIVAPALDYGAPMVGFWLPGAGRTPMSDWTLSPGHLAERCQLVVIIALGESILDTGTGFAELGRTTERTVAFLVAFLGSAALWWLYFARHAEAALGRVSESDDPARIGRGGYTYAHGLMVAGIIVGAVADELVIRHPGAPATTAFALCELGGAALYLAGMATFVFLTGGLDRAERIAVVVILAGLIALGLAAGALSALALALGTTLALAALVAFAAWHAAD